MENSEYGKFETGTQKLILEPRQLVPKKDKEISKQIISKSKLNEPQEKVTLGSSCQDSNKIFPKYENYDEKGTLCLRSNSVNIGITLSPTRSSKTDEMPSTINYQDEKRYSDIP